MTPVYDDQPDGTEPVGAPGDEPDRQPGPEGPSRRGPTYENPNEDETYVPPDPDAGEEDLLSWGNEG